MAKFFYFSLSSLRCLCVVVSLLKVEAIKTETN